MITKSDIQVLKKISDFCFNHSTCENCPFCGPKEGSCLLDNIPDLWILEKVRNEYVEENK